MFTLHWLESMIYEAIRQKLSTHYKQNNRQMNEYPVEELN